MAAGLKVWSASQWTGVGRRGSLKVEDLSGAMTGACVGRVKGPSCQWVGGLAAARRVRAGRVRARREVQAWAMWGLRMWKPVWGMGGCFVTG
jgi:hypothetical protein